MMVTHLGGMLENWRDQVRDRSEKRGTWNGLGGIP